MDAGWFLGEIAKMFWHDRHPRLRKARRRCRKCRRRRRHLLMRRVPMHLIGSSCTRSARFVKTCSAPISSIPIRSSRTKWCRSWNKAGRQARALSQRRLRDMEGGSPRSKAHPAIPNDHLRRSR
jgi:hypothetical protein